MRIRNLQGRSAGLVEDMDETTGQSMLDSGQGELVAQEAVEAVETVAEVAKAAAAAVEAVEAAKAAEAVRVSEGLLVVVADYDDDETGTGDTDDSPLASWTTAELEDLGDEYNIEATDIEGTGSGGNVVKADWVRVLEARMAEDDGEDEGSEAEG